MIRVYILILLCITFTANAQFTGKSGVYFLGSANTPVSTTSFSNPSINGVVVRFRWNDLEPTPGNFNWTFVDAEIAKAVTYHKKISLQPLGIPDWMDSIRAQQYYQVDENAFHATYRQITSGIVPWDSTYISRFKILLQRMATKYAADTTISYVNTIGGAFSRGLPDSIVTDTILRLKQPFWTAFNYNADTLAKLMNQMTDYYMELFPSTPLWCSVDYVSFQNRATGQAQNYLASLYIAYGLSHYPDRFGFWREDLSACNPQTNINPSNQWYLMNQQPCRTGAQMLWHVQDGPARMNQCGILPNTKSIVLDSAVNKGLKLGMRYLEIYGSDINDATLVTSIHQANNKLVANAASCNTALALSVTDFKAQCNGNLIAISWKNQSTNNAVSFEIEKSTDGFNWQILTTISAAATSIFTYTDPFVRDNNYYRLKQFDSRNEVAYSAILFARNCNKNIATVFPNPAKSNISISFPNPGWGNYKAVLYTATGSVTRLLLLSASTTIDVKNLPAGLYFIKSVTGDFPTIKFVKL